MGRDQPKVMDVSALRMREATVAAGLWLTFAVAGLGELYVVLTWQRANRLELALLFALAIAAAAVVGLLPRERIVRSRMREPFFLVWTMADVGVLVVATLADGGTSSPLVLVLFLPVVFSSMTYPLVSVVVVGAVSVASYLALALTDGGLSFFNELSFSVALVCTAAMSAWQAQSHKRQHRALATASRTDPLTGCLNRRGFEERARAHIDAMRRRRQRGALVMLDIDHFKPVNDTYGHAAGDELLCWVAGRLAQVVRPSDAVGRLGGDEFAVLLPAIDADSARASAARIAEALATRAPASLGLAIFPDEATNLEELARQADARLYASRQGRPVRARPPADETAAVREPGSIEPAQLWRAALEAMPPDTAVGTDGRDLQSALLDQIDASVVVTDMEGVVISWNSGAEALYGWSAEEAVGANARDLIVPHHAAAAERLVVELSRDGRWDGELLVRRKDGTLFTAYLRNRLVRDEEGRPSAIVGVALDVSARKAAESELLHSRNYAQAITECMGEGLFTLDVEGRVTYVNRTAQALLGHPAGELDGRLLGETVEPRRVIDPERPFQDSPIARCLRRDVTVHVDDAVFLGADGREVPVSYTATPFHTDEGLQGCVVIFRDISERKRRERERERDAATLACIDRVESALREERLVLHAQPIVDLRSGRTVQHELLLRMTAPDGSLVAPGEFLPVAEKYALIGEIDWWVIKRAASLAGAGCPVELNVSARTVGDPDVLDHVARCIEQHNVAPGTMVFEITETALVRDERAAQAFVEGLHRLGCKIALDDFGTGYATLTYVKQMPVDYLKIDIEFVRDILVNKASRHVVQAVVALAHDLGLQTVAEGVEDERTLALLCRLGVDFAQGFHLARPQAFAERPGDLAAPVSVDVAALAEVAVASPYHAASRTGTPRRARRLAGSGRQAR